MILTQKETMLLQDLKTQEQVCIEKYNQYAERANDPKLSQLLRTISSAEQQHLSTLEQMEKGTVPAMGGGQKQPFQPPASAPASAIMMELNCCATCMKGWVKLLVNCK